jgi:hypothetical protein
MQGHKKVNAWFIIDFSVRFAEALDKLRKKNTK